MAPIRLAILEADVLAPTTAARYSNYTGLFTSLLTSALAPSALAPRFAIARHHIFKDTSAYPALEDVDAVLVTGSKQSAYQDDEWILALVDYVRRAIEGGRVRVVGVCFGHQIVGRAMGVGVGVSEAGWELAVTEVDLSEEGKKVFGLEKMRIHQVHRDEVKSVPPNIHALASTPSCPVQAMCLPGRYLTIQGHPEFTEDIVREIADRQHGMGSVSDELYEDAIRRVGLEHDGVAIARAFVKFLEE
ncbi:related to P.aeruginosa anthranilate synthase component II [Cephalotrichum gorgonifer]|uniref:Related to P.aeruginosa anthranilate synthase component II n=1 Tax=Cephalotrichum gorgonifer TaxID=2041049 RepID=A0AAE8MV92_9PEZI|nr:related to P.aeruginosa anthranilate synthase component II [Cephalotrichum gorgonifer]